MTVYTTAAILARLRKELKKRSAASVSVDLSDVTLFDDFGTLVLAELRRWSEGGGGSMDIGEAGESVRQVMEMIGFDKPDTCRRIPPQKRENPLTKLGGTTLEEVGNLKQLVAFVGAVAMAFGHILRNPRSLRWGETLAFMEKTGVNALPIVGLISFLLGLVIAFMSSLQLRQFGANIYVASLVAIAMISELGPIMTAIMVAGRSGSAFAAEIGTMKISEEIDALLVMGMDPTIFLAAPRIVASMIVVPLLTIFANLFAVAGGLTVGVFVLNLTVNTYMAKTIEALTLFEVCWGLSKSLIFAVIIVLVGCFRGFQTRGGADAVGNAATSAVVTSIFLIILFDSIFAVSRSYW
jgi:phospholipid/cholesterol/gamma-HCH transport system permease protein